MLKPVLCTNTTKCVLKALKNTFILSKIDLGMARNLTLSLNGLELMLVWGLVWINQRETYWGAFVRIA